MRTRLTRLQETRKLKNSNGIFLHFCHFDGTASKMADLSAASAVAGGAGAVPSADAGPAAMSVAIDAALSNLKPLRDLAQNWDIDIASW